MQVGDMKIVLNIDGEKKDCDQQFTDDLWLPVTIYDNMVIYKDILKATFYMCA